jgi:hypothetical protein
MWSQLPLDFPHLRAQLLCLCEALADGSDIDPVVHLRVAQFFAQLSQLGAQGYGADYDGSSSMFCCAM